MSDVEQTGWAQCTECVHRRDVPGDCHIRCANPDREMRGNAHAIENGWWFYPSLFDPVWNQSVCTNHEEDKE